MDDVLLAGTRALNGLLAGTYVAFLVAVMPALRGAPDDTFIEVMNRINVGFATLGSSPCSLERPPWRCPWLPCAETSHSPLRWPPPSR